VCFSQERSKVGSKVRDMESKDKVTTKKIKDGTEMQRGWDEGG
jgi:hypothetical protein